MAELEDHPVGLVQFDGFEVNLGSGELLKEGVKLKFGGVPFQLLAVLLERPGEVVTRDELQKRLWPDTFVDVDRNLNTSINRIRDVLGDSAESPRYVETVPRRGYRFIGPVQKSDSERNGPPKIQKDSASRSRRIIPSVLVGGGLLAIALAFLGWRLTAGKVARSSRSPSASVNLHIVPLTRLPGAVYDPAFSPDGEKLAFFWNGERTANRFDLYVQLVGADKPLRLTNTTDPHGYCVVRTGRRMGRELPSPNVVIIAAKSM